MRPSHYHSRYKDQLTPRQREVTDLLTRGKTNAEIAQDLGLGWETVKSHVSEVLAKLKVETREEAAVCWRYERSASAVLSRALRGALAFAVGPWVRVASAAGAIGVMAVVAVFIALAVSRPDPVREAPPAVVTPDTLPAVSRYARISTCCVQHHVTVAGDSTWIISGANVTNWQSQVFRSVRGSTTLDRVDLDVLPLVTAGSGTMLWVSHPEAYDFKTDASREANRSIPGKPGDVSRIAAFEVPTLARRQSFVAPGRVDQLAADAQSVWTISVLDNVVAQFDASSGLETHRLEIQGIGEATTAQSHLWVTLPKRDETVRVNGLTGAIDMVATVPGDCHCGIKLASAGNVVWVQLFARNSLARIDASDPTNVVEVGLEASPAEIAAGEDGSLWVALSTVDEIVLLQLDPVTGATLKRVPLGRFEGTPDAMGITSTEVWVIGQKGEVVRVSR